MSDERVVLVTGVADYWGERLARRLLQEEDVRVIGLDVERPEDEVQGLDFIQADVRNPLLAELLRDERVNTVCHLAFIESIRRNEAIFDFNVMGTMKIVGASAESGVDRVILKSSTMVYGAHPDNDAFLTEGTSLRGSRRYGYNRYRLEVESFINGFRRQAPGLEITLLRFANILGPTADTPLNSYLRTHVSPILLGFDPMLQVIHEDDVVEALAHAVFAENAGAFNVASDPPLPLLRILGLAGKVPLPILHPLAYWGVNRLGLRKLAHLEPDYLRYRWVGDLSRMREELQFFPEKTGDEVVESLGVYMRMKQYQRPRAEDIAYDEDRLRATIERRRQARHAQDGQGRRSRTHPEAEEGTNG
jgi:UDP-glucose 4-epimerase